MPKKAVNWKKFMGPFIVLLGTQIWNTKIKSSKLVNKNVAQNVMATFGFGRRFHDLKHFEVIFLFILLEFIIT